MANFSFTVEDLADDTASSVVREQTKDLTNPAVPLMTSRAAYGRQSGDLESSTEVSTLSLGQALMGIPLYDDPENAVAKHEALNSDLLGATIRGDNTNKDDPDYGLGVFDLVTPSDLLLQGSVNRLQQEQLHPEGTGGGAGGDVGGATGGPIDLAQASADGKRFTSNTAMVHFQGTGGGSLAKQDIETGKIAPNLIYALSILTQQVGIEISCAASDLSGNRNQGHSAGSPHYAYRAVDIAAMFDPKTGQTWTYGDNALIRKAMSILNSITGPMRPSQVITNVPSSYPGFDVRSDHADHMHVGVSSFIQPPPAADQVKRGAF